jgi:hypothetical protein
VRLRRGVSGVRKLNVAEIGGRSSMLVLGGCRERKESGENESAHPHGVRLFHPSRPVKAGTPPLLPAFRLHAG